MGRISRYFYASKSESSILQQPLFFTDRIERKRWITMKQQKKSWVKTLLSFAESCKGKMILSVLCAIFSVAGGFIPFWAVYKSLLLFINRTATGNYILLWCLVGVGGDLIRVRCFGISTILAHISAYTILEGIRLKIANRLMKAPVGEVMGRRIGYLKNIIMDKVEDLEPPLRM